MLFALGVFRRRGFRFRLADKDLFRCAFELECRGVRFDGLESYAVVKGVADGKYLAVDNRVSGFACSDDGRYLERWPLDIGGFIGGREVDDFVRRRCRRRSLRVES